jgi:hypothetical protein
LTSRIHELADREKNREPAEKSYAETADDGQRRPRAPAVAKTALIPPD